MPNDTATDEQADIRKDFAEAINMTPAALEKWLDSDDSRAVGWKGDDGDGDGCALPRQRGALPLELWAVGLES